jgi:DnaJ family protein C protein 13
MLAARALAKLGGFMEGELSTPYNQEATAVLRGLLTPRVATQLKDRSPRELLRNLTSNLETPHVSFSSSFNSTFILSERYSDGVMYIIVQVEAVTCIV